MADIEFECPHCTHMLAVDERGAGLEVNCPECGKLITIPETPDSPLPIEEESSCCDSPLPEDANICDTQLRTDKKALSLALKSKIEALSDALKTFCPNCGTQLHPKAIICGKCRTDFRTGTKLVRGFLRSPIIAALYRRVVFTALLLVGLIVIVGISRYLKEQLADGGAIRRLVESMNTKPKPEQADEIFEKTYEQANISEISVTNADEASSDTNSVGLFDAGLAKKIARRPEESKGDAFGHSGPHFIMRGPNKRLYGPYPFEQGTRIGSGSRACELVVMGTNRFEVMIPSTGTRYGPFEYADRSILHIRDVHFTLLTADIESYREEIAEQEEMIRERKLKLMAEEAQKREQGLIKVNGRWMTLAKARAQKKPKKQKIETYRPKTAAGREAMKRFTGRAQRNAPPGNFEDNLDYYRKRRIERAKAAMRADNAALSGKPSTPPRPPTATASERYLVQMADRHVLSMISSGRLIDAQRTTFAFQPVRGNRTCDAKATVGYTFQFYTQAGLVRRNDGSLYFYHDPLLAQWILSDVNIDGLPRY